MSFQEKSTWVLLAAMLAVYGWYASATFGGLAESGVPETADNMRLIGTVGLMIVISIVAHIAIAIVTRSEDESDERDRLIDLRGDQRGGFIMALGLLGTLTLALTGGSLFWIAHAALGGLVAGELVKSISKLIDCRRGV
ncbi:hypothetical protein V0U79_03565 [Hyphobacterium sp. HN65]|uniref:Uncharacterized protein n=1 Tax=Hyphobacterium lacteum TaxID=3116575 RepID=A0ABU7LNH0_9PROT|nr:hypothetical protein [Hyphobacterium sp. HN65]MEE2525432.1 hypothetical protein [Hyphobacterium sp. HN65]